MKKKLAATLSVVLILGLAVLGILAYLTDTDSDVNVMTLGNVSINQHEYERVVDEDGNYEMTTVTKVDGSTQESYKVQEFKQDKPLYPATGEVTRWDETYVRWEQLGDSNKVNGGQTTLAGLNNIQDKFVLVENTGKSDAYVRTIVAFELGDVAEADWETIIQPVYATQPEPWTPTNIGKATIGENNYYVIEFTYAGYSYGNMRHNGGILPAGEWTYSNLAQIYMTSAATNEDVEAIDGNKNGKYDILVLSQAVQTAGFDNAQIALDTAFGDVTAENAAKWFTNIPVGYQVSNSEELAAAVAAGETEIWLNPGEYDVYGAGNKTLTINGTKEAVITPKNEGEDGCDYGFDSSTVTFNGVTIDTSKNGGNYKGFARMTATFNNCEIFGAYTTYRAQTFNNCKFNTNNGYIWIWSAPEVNFNKCNFGGNSKTILAHGWETSVVNITDCTFEASEKGFASGPVWTAAVEIDPAGTNTYTINFKGTNTKNDNYAGWTRIKDGSAGHVITGIN